MLAAIRLLFSDRDPRLPLGHVVVELLRARLVADAPQKFIEVQLVGVPEVIVISEPPDEYLLKRHLLKGSAR